MALNRGALDLDSLNPEQRAAVTHTEGPLLVLAGAGSGKTRVITTRIAYLILHKRVPAPAVLAVTFTNKAAREMAERVAGQVKGTEGGARGGPLISTFHAFGARLLREHITLLGYRPNFVIFDAQEQFAVVKSILEDGAYDEALFSAKSAFFALQQAKGKGLTAQELRTRRGDPAELALGAILDEYEQALKRMNAVDFEDILRLSLRLCREFPAETRPFLERFRYVMVDEYQDTNRCQFDLLKALAGGRRNVCVVGDDDQSIYRWRGAEPGNILDFERVFPGCRTIRLERNYRSTDTILAAANQVIRHNAARKEKTLRGHRGPGRPLEWLLGEDEHDELTKVVAHLRRTLLQDGGHPGDAAILYRSNHQSRAIEENLREEGLPYTLVGGTRFFDRKEVRDALAYLRVIAAPSDEVSLFRILNFPRRGIGRTSQAKLSEYAARQHRPCIDVLREASRFQDFTGPVARSMETFAALIGRFRERFAHEPLPAAFRALMAELDFHRAVEKERADPKSGEKAAGLIVELERTLDYFARTRPEAGLKELLDHVALMAMPEQEEADSRPRAITLSTVHAAKGLEFPYVYLVGLADEVFPHKRSLAEGGEDEERRLFYVAVTRAQRQLVLSMARQRRRYGETLRQQPSRFLLEIEARLFEGESPQGDYVGGAPVKARRTEEAKGRFLERIKGMGEGRG
ncbi:MAG: UvrD-helicase domain-containing protein [Candidatus Lambdaproteobacteria bacterium]|nr:UvrD-helicase domain-containing protein [Candidatus Lambdaproteobacteria bacterium]